MLNMASKFAPLFLKGITSSCCINQAGLRFIRTSAARGTSFWEPHIKGDKQYREKEISLWKYLKDGYKLVGPEFKMFYEEFKETMRMDPPIHVPGVQEVLWNFNCEEDLQNWITTSDSDHNEGYSTGKFYINENKKGCFTGNLDQKLPKDGKVKIAGYSNIKHIRFMRSFKRNVYKDWSMYTHLLVKLRGDGRTYMLNLHTEGTFDIMWHDIYSYGLYTRGGPYWQIAKIPFSKFFLTSKGKIQDKQAILPSDYISSIGITIGDTIPGPFRLEIDSIGVYSDPNAIKEFAYETYQVPPRLFGA